MDLNELKSIAENINSFTITIQTTRRPENESINNVSEQKVSRCTIPIIMVCFSVIDMLGQWVNQSNDNDFKHSSAFFEKLAFRDNLKNKQTCQKVKRSL